VNTPRDIALAQLAATRLGPNVPVYDRLDGPHAWIDHKCVYWRICCLEWRTRHWWYGPWLGLN